MTEEDARHRLFAERLRQAAITHYGKERGVATLLAKDMGVVVQTSSKWLRGDVMPTPERWGVLAALLNVPTTWLTGTTHETPQAVQRHFPNSVLERASQAFRVVFPLVVRLKPDIGQQQLDELIRHAYAQLEAGVSETQIAGEVAQALFD